MASSYSITLSSFCNKSNFLGQNRIISNRPNHQKPQSHQTLITYAKFNLSEIMGGRGLCNGEAGLKNELSKTIDPPKSTVDPIDQPQPEKVNISIEEGFEKELLGLTGGFPGGEKGLRSFIEKNPPPPKEKKSKGVTKTAGISLTKVKIPELPLLLPGMIAIVKNPNNPYYMYTGIIQRITDGKAGVLFEGGNWDHLITFRLEELERREKGPPGKNPKSAILEPLLKNDPQ